MKRIALIMLIQVVLSLSIFCQVQLSGFVTDGETGERLIGATVYLQDNKHGTATNEFGHYHLDVPEGNNFTLCCSYVGYTLQKKELIIYADSILNIRMHPGKELDEVLVTHQNNPEHFTEMGTSYLSMKDVKKLPAIGGELDLIKAMQLLPGVQSGNEGSSGLYVRGGSPDQNLVMIDDVPLYYVNHLGGFVSIFNPDIINNVKLIKGSFPSRYGSRLSSVIDIRMKEGNMKKRQVSGTAGLITMKLAVEGPIKIDTSSYIISVRRFMYDLLMMPLTKIVYEGASLGYTFYDVNAKYNHTFSTTDRFYFSFYNGRDKSTINIKDKDVAAHMKSKTIWGNIATSVRWNHLFTPKLFSNFTAYYTRYDYGTEETYSIDSTASNTPYVNNYNFNSGIRDIGIKIDLSQNIASFYELKYGVGSVFHTFKPSQTILSESADKNSIEKNFGFNTLNAIEGFAYMENHIRIGHKTSLNMGGRYNLYWVEGENFNYIEPRLVFAHKMHNGYTYKVGYTKMDQFVHLLSSTGLGIPADYWLPATKELIPSTSQQIGFSLEREVSGGIYSWSVEPYYKTMNNLIAFKEGYSHLYIANDWQLLVEPNGHGVSYGIELFVEKKIGDYTGWIGYTLARTTRQFENINLGRVYSYKYDRRHDLSLVVNRKIKENVDFCATWVFGTGNAFTLAESRYFAITKPGRLSEAEVYSEKNAYRMRPYHRLDVALNIYKKTSWGERTWSFSIYNLYNRKNPYFYYWNASEPNTDTYSTGMKLYQYSYFPIIPSVSYSFKF